MMSAISQGTSLGNSVIGNIQKAVLIFGTAGMTANSAAGDSGSITAMAQAALNRRGLSNASLLDTAGTRHMEVQYNPASLRFSANADSVMVRSLQNSIEEGVINQSCRAPSVSMAVDLIFNAVNVKDSFMADKFRVSPNDVATDVASGLTAAKGGYSVQTQSNGLLAAAMFEGSRFVTFQWADLSFSGELVDVGVKYSMFSVSGKPVHSIVTLRIVQQLRSSAADTAWNQAKFDECFSGKSSANIGQSVSNLINITGF